MRKIAGLFTALFTLAVIGLIGLFVYVDSIAKAGVERGATYALGVNTTVDGVDVGLLTGGVDLDRLKVSNPPGFESPDFLNLENGRLRVALASLRQEQVEAPKLTLRGVHLHLERRGNNANYKVIMENLKRFERSVPTTPRPQEPGKKFIIRELAVEDITVQVDLLGAPGGLTRLPLIIERIELRDVGSDSDRGVLMSELINIILKAVLEAVARVGGNLLPAEVMGELSAGLQGLSEVGIQVIGDVSTMVDGRIRRLEELGDDILRQGVDQAGKQLEEAGKQIGEEVKKGLDDLLGGKNKKPDPDGE